MNRAAALLLAQPPFRPAPRYWSGNFCGVRVPGLPPVPGGAVDASLVLSWFYDRYSPSNQARIRSTWKAHGYTHIVLSWPDSRAYGQSAEQFGATCRELIADGFYPCPFLCSKDYDPPKVAQILANIAPVLPFLVGLVPLACIGWELSLWLSPVQVQQLIDALAPMFVADRARVYVHFGQRVFSWQVDPGIAADFWKKQVGKLTGLLAQFQQENTDDHDRLDWIHDCLERCAGHDFMPVELIDGHPVDFIALEITAIPQFNGNMSEAEGNRIGQVCIDAPSVSGPAGTVRVMGSGNGHE